MENKQDTPKRSPGRPMGALSKIAKEAREKAIATGLLPHEILLSMARGELQKQEYLDEKTGEVLVKLVSVDIEARRDAAKAAAPYYAPKMATVEVFKTGSEDELDAIIKELAAQTGIGLSFEGEGETGSTEGGDEEESAVDQPAFSRRRAFTDEE